tara:strand:- start:728 stop:1417 length:690 start_codon:yes stop_codon:yes gene_type:complete
MAQGFGNTQVTGKASTSGEQTLFEKVTLKAGGDKKSLSWYRSTIKTLATTYTKNFERYIRDEKKDRGDASVDQDSNELRRYVMQGHMYMFEYKAKMQYLPYYDKFPLVYVIKSDRSQFWGLNLHYLPLKKRIAATNKLINGRIDFPKNCLHKYLHSHVQGLYLDLALTEWDSAILLPSEHFVKSTQKVEFNIAREDVWNDTNETFYDKFRAQRVVKGYGTTASKEMALS